ncbi:MAG: chemotaxis protein CheB [Chloroflexota bacterium]|nr:chemotaxis protein CheB [Chloroflexota bacterium]
MPGHDRIVIGASAGGVEALMAVVWGLPRDLPAALFVVLHVPPDGESMLPRILSHAGPLPAIHPQDGDPIEEGRIYVAPPDYHLLIERDHVRVIRGPRENRYRPAVDPLFRSAARAYGPRVVAVVLSGMLDDGAAGMTAVHARGGISVVQDPSDALFPGMPTSAMRYGDPDYSVPATEIGPLLDRLAREAVHETVKEASEGMEKETDIAALDLATLNDPDKPGMPSVFGCPECGGVLWEMKEGPLLRYRCRVGHAYTADSLLSEQSLHLEAALWAALRGLEEKAALVHRLAERARDAGHGMLADRYAEQGRDAQQHAAIIRDLVLRGDTSPADIGIERQRETGDG